MKSLLARTSVIIPALNEEATVAQVVRSCLADDPREVLVIDADSTDHTAAVAAAAGARVINWREIFPQLPTRPGKGESLWRGVAAATGEFVCFIDADLESAVPGMVTALVEPLADAHIHMVRPVYERTLAGRPHGGGRVTELLANPLLEIYFPELNFVTQPLGGEYALRTSTARALPFVDGYGVEAGLLIDVFSAHGAAAIAQSELPPRRHRNRPLHELRPMSAVVARTILHRAGALPASQSGLVLQRPPLETVK